MRPFVCSIFVHYVNKVHFISSFYFISFNNFNINRMKRGNVQIEINYLGLAGNDQKSLPTVSFILDHFALPSQHR
jgi:hypothetical protein